MEKGVASAWTGTPFHHPIIRQSADQSGSATSASECGEALRLDTRVLRGGYPKHALRYESSKHDLLKHSQAICIHGTLLIPLPPADRYRPTTTAGFPPSLSYRVLHSEFAISASTVRRGLMSVCIPVGH